MMPRLFTTSDRRKPTSEFTAVVVWAACFATFSFFSAILIPSPGIFATLATLFIIHKHAFICESATSTTGMKKAASPRLAASKVPEHRRAREREKARQRSVLSSILKRLSLLFSLACAVQRLSWRVLRFSCSEPQLQLRALRRGLRGRMGRRF